LPASGCYLDSEGTGSTSPLAWSRTGPPWPGHDPGGNGLTSEP